MSTAFFAVLTGFVWMGLTADLGWETFAFGALFAIAIRRAFGIRSRRPFGVRRTLQTIRLALYLVVQFVWELLVANLEQLRIVLAPRIDVHPGWIRFQSSLETPAMRALLGAIISLTPGSVTYEDQSSDEGCFICLHVLDLRDEARVIEQIRHRFEAPLRAMEQL